MLTKWNKKWKLFPSQLAGLNVDLVEYYVYLSQRFTLTEKNQDNEIRSIKVG